MDDALAVSVVERFRDFRHDLGDLLVGKLRLLAEEHLQVLSLNVLHRDEGNLGLRVLADVMDRDDVGVRQDAGRLRLADEPLAKLLGVFVVAAGIDADGLYRHHPADDGVPREVNDAHRALTQLADDFVATELRDSRACDPSICHVALDSTPFPRRRALRAAEKETWRKDAGF